jgi:transcriptional regulator with XRE-family HTH domain
MINGKLLKSIMKLHGDTQESLSDYLGISFTTMNRKINGLNEFVQSEIKSIALKYKLTTDEIKEIFFN